MTARALVLTGSIDVQFECIEVAAGEAVIASFRSPEKDGLNEDAAVVVAVDDEHAVFAVADGVGSTRSAHEASQAVVDALAEITQRSGTVSRAAIVDGIELANRRVRDAGAGAATTVAVIELNVATVRPIHVGDSGVLVVGQRGRLRLQTMPHSPVGYAVEAGVMDEGEAMHHEDRHIVSNVIGSDDMRIEIGGTLRLARRDTVVLATDGVFDNLHLDELIEFVRAGPLMDAATRVMTAVRHRMVAPREGEPSKPDDTTLILYRRKR